MCDSLRLILGSVNSHAHPLNAGVMRCTTGHHTSHVIFSYVILVRCGGMMVE